MSKSFSNANFPVTPEGRTYHVNTKKGEVANRIITVGDASRALHLATLLDAPPQVYTSKRGFSTFTGSYQGKPISIISIGMGTSMMDFFVREVREVVEGPMVVIRFGSCGSIADDAMIGQMVVANSACFIQRKVDLFTDLYQKHQHQDEKSNHNGSSQDSSNDVKNNTYNDRVDNKVNHQNKKQKKNVDEDLPIHEAYSISVACPSDAKVTEKLKSALEKRLGQEKVVVGMNATADTFYASQGRQDPSFIDHNTQVISDLKKQYPQAKILEMETFMLFHLSKCSKTPIYSGACAMVFADRISNDFIDPDTIKYLEENAGKAVLDAVIQFEI